VDDQDDREYSRAPELEDLLSLCQALNAAGARHVLTGGFAAILNGFVRATKEIDLLPKYDPNSRQPHCESAGQPA
jgi:hypothetical protein